MLPKGGKVSMCTRLLATMNFKSNAKLEKIFTLFRLIFLGISCCIGCGAYSVIGFAAQHAGPSISVSFILTGIMCFFTCLPYAEFSSKIQSTGFSYAYVYASFGELPAYLTGHALHLVLIASAAIAARCWASYINIFLSSFGIHLWPWLYDQDFHGISVCMMGAVLVIFFTLLMLWGMKESTTVNNTISIINVGTLIFAVIVGFSYVKEENYSNFMPNGYQGMFAGMGLAFFSYLGFEGLGCFAEEAVNAERDLPISFTIVLSIAILAYAGVAFVMTGMAPLSVLNTNESLIQAFLYNNCPYIVFIIINIGSLAGLTGSVSANMMSQPRIFYAMAQDGLLPPCFEHINEKTGTMDNSVIVTGVLSVLIVLFFDVETVGNSVAVAGLLISSLVDILTVTARYESELPASKKIKAACAVFYIAAFFGPFLMYYQYSYVVGGILIALMVLIFIYVQFNTQTNVPQNIFTCPLVPLVPMVGASTLLTISATVDRFAWILFGCYMFVGLITYFVYGYSHSKLGMAIEEGKVEDTEVSKEMEALTDKK